MWHKCLQIYDDCFVSCIFSPLFHKSTPVSFIIPETGAYWKFFDRLKRPEIERFQVFFRLKSVFFVRSVVFIREVAEHLLSAELYVPEFVPELRWHTLDRASHYPTLGNWMTLQELPSGSSGPLRPVGKALLNRSMASSRMDSCTWR